MITRRTIIDQIELTRSGTVQVRFRLAIEEDGVAIAEPKLHRTAIEPGGDVEAALASVDADITSRQELKAAPTDRDHMADALKAVCGLVAVTPGE
jgi:hypothetical protein